MNKNPELFGTCRHNMRFHWYTLNEELSTDDGQSPEKVNDTDETNMEEYELESPRNWEATKQGASQQMEAPSFFTPPPGSTNVCHPTVSMV